MQERKSTTKNTKADGFMNLVVVDNKGNRHNFKMGIPLHKERPLDAMLMADPKLVESFSIENIELTVNPVKELVTPVF